MGGTQSRISERELQYYQETTFLDPDEILEAIDRFFTIADTTTNTISLQTFTSLPEFAINPFASRLYDVFAKGPGIPMENWIQLVSTMSFGASIKVKKAVAFRVFDFNDDNCITREDVAELLKVLMGVVDLRVARGLETQTQPDLQVPDLANVLALRRFSFARKTARTRSRVNMMQNTDDASIDELARWIFLALDLDHSDELEELEFERVVDQIPDFDVKFSVKLL